MKINYVIASHAGVSAKRERYDETTAYVLRQQLEGLLNVADTLRYITQITIVVPKIIGKYVYPEYYDIKDLKGEFLKRGIMVKKIQCSDFGISYNHWITAMRKYPDFDYHILMEDDYCPHPSATGFDETLVKIFEEKFGKEPGYLCTYAPRDGKRGFAGQMFHAAISNGMMNKKAVDRYIGRSDPKVVYTQVSFSQLGLSFGVKIDDYSDGYAIPFWESTEGCIKDFSPNRSNKQFIVPVQMLNGNYPLKRVAIDDKLRPYLIK